MVRIVTVTEPSFTVEVSTPDPSDLVVATTVEELYIGASTGPPGPAGADGADGNDLEEEMYDLEIDESVPGVTYIGQALPGSATSSAVWRIRKITEITGGTSVDWAGGTSLFDQVWDDRLSLTYGP